jgi:hypothetical protein
MWNSPIIDICSGMFECEEGKKREGKEMGVAELRDPGLRWNRCRAR